MSAPVTSTDTAGAQALALSTSRRLVALDVLRGLAILGTLLTNIWLFSSSSVSSLADLGGTGGEASDQFGGDAARIVDQLLQFVTDGKWIGLLTIMFGIGLEIQRQSALRRGETWPGTYPWRAGLLVLEGTLNYVFIFEFDVLMGYGLTALVVAAVLATSPKAQKIWLWIGLALHAVMITVLTLLPGQSSSRSSIGAGDAAAKGNAPAPVNGATAPPNGVPAEGAPMDGAPLEGTPMEGAPADGATGGQEISQQFFADLERLPSDASPEQVQALATQHGLSPEEVQQFLGAVGNGGGGLRNTESYWGMVAERLETFVAGRFEIPIMFTMGLGLFLVGAFLYRKGLFLPEGKKLRMKVIAFGFLVGLPLDIACRTLWAGTTSSLSRYGTSSMVAFGVLGVVAAFYARRTRTGAVGTGLSWVGRMAMTCYVLQNLICSVIFYDFGLGLAGKLPAEWNTWGTLAVYVGVALFLVFGSGLWLRRFSRGPLEMLMHRAHRGLVAKVHVPLARRRRERRRARAESSAVTSE